MAAPAELDRLPRRSRIERPPDCLLVASERLPAVVPGEEGHELGIGAAPAALVVDVNPSRLPEQVPVWKRGKTRGDPRRWGCPHRRSLGAPRLFGDGARPIPKTPGQPRGIRGASRRRNGRKPASGAGSATLRFWIAPRRSPVRVRLAPFRSTSGFRPACECARSAPTSLIPNSSPKPWRVARALALGSRGEAGGGQDPGGHWHRFGRAIGADVSFEARTREGLLPVLACEWACEGAWR